MTALDLLEITLQRAGAERPQAILIRTLLEKVVRGTMHEAQWKNEVPQAMINTINGPDGLELARLHNTLSRDFLLKFGGEGSDQLSDIYRQIGLN